MNQTGSQRIQSVFSSLRRIQTLRTHQLEAPAAADEDVKIEEVHDPEDDALVRREMRRRINTEVRVLTKPETEVERKVMDTALLVGQICNLFAEHDSMDQLTNSFGSSRNSIPVTMQQVSQLVQYLALHAYEKLNIIDDVSPPLPDLVSLVLVRVWRNTRVTDLTFQLAPMRKADPALQKRKKAVANSAAYEAFEEEEKGAPPPPPAPRTPLEEALHQAKRVLWIENYWRFLQSHDTVVRYAQKIYKFVFTPGLSRVDLSVLLSPITFGPAFMAHFDGYRVCPVSEIMNRNGNLALCQKFETFFEDYICKNTETTTEEEARLLAIANHLPYATILTDKRFKVDQEDEKYAPVPAALAERHCGVEGVTYIFQQSDLDPGLPEQWAHANRMTRDAYFIAAIEDFVSTKLAITTSFRARYTISWHELTSPSKMQLFTDITYLLVPVRPFMVHVAEKVWSVCMRHPDRPRDDMRVYHCNSLPQAWVVFTDLVQEYFGSQLETSEDTRSLRCPSFGAESYVRPSDA